MKVLHIDDEPDFVKQTKIFLEKKNSRLNIETATSAEEGLELLKENNYDAIISDYKMPQMDGLKFLKTIREEMNSDIPFIILTGKGHEEVAMKALNLGANRYLQKDGNTRSQYNILADAIVHEAKHGLAEEELSQSEEKSKAVFEAVEDGVIIIDLEGNIVEANKSASDMIGLKGEKDLISRNAFELVHPEDREIAEELAEKFFEGKEAEKREYRALTADGDVIHVHSSAGLVRDNSGKVIGIVNVIRDITKRKEAEKKLREAKLKYQKLFEAAPDPAYLIGKEGTFERVNEPFAKKSGYDREEIIGVSLGDSVPFLPEESRRKAVENFKKRVVDEDIPPYPLEIRTKDGGTIHVEINARPLKEDDKIVGEIGIARDITERKKAEERERFLHSLLRHDLGNKIQTVWGYVELLEDFDLPEEAEKYLSSLMRGVEEGREIIEKVGLLRDAQEEEIREMEVEPPIFSAVDQFEGLAEEKGIEINADCQEKGCRVVAGSLLSNVFSNIIENSVQHSGGNEIRVWEEVDEDEVKCVIEDDGKGVPDDKKNKIFDKGYTTDEERGTGLGMFLVKTLLDIYGGDIKVKDSESGGARFDVYLQKV